MENGLLTAQNKKMTTVSLPGAVAIQGFEGSFHQQAARIFLGNETEVIPCSTFSDLIKTTSNSPACGGALMAIENSIAGSILPNYNLLQKSTLKIIGEVYLHIRQNLLVNPGVSLEDIREVHSHPMALQQCLDFLETKNWKLIETEDTALSAKHVHQYKSKHIAAIAGVMAAELYGLNIAVPDIHTLKNNYTRFLVLAKDGIANEIPGANKASVNFHTDHSRGSLAKVLTIVAEGGVNLSKLQSFPIPGSDFKYSFHADMEFDSTEQFNNILRSIQPHIKHLRVYGVYKNGKEALINKN